MGRRGYPRVFQKRVCIKRGVFITIRVANALHLVSVPLAQPRALGFGHNLCQSDQPSLGLQARLHITLGRAQIGMTGDALHVPQACSRLGAAASQVGQEGPAARVAAGSRKTRIPVDPLEPVCDAVGAIASAFRKDNWLPRFDLLWKRRAKSLYGRPELIMDPAPDVCLLAALSVCR